MSLMNMLVNSSGETNYCLLVFNTGSKLVTSILSVNSSKLVPFDGARDAEERTFA